MDLDAAARPFWDKISPHFIESDLKQIQSAWAIAVAAHNGQFRQSGEPYVTHPLAVAEILFDTVDVDADAICAALLHDVVEDTDYSIHDIRRQFGGDVALIVDGVSKLVAATNIAPNESKDSTLRKLVLAGGTDRRVFAVKLADRLHNMRTLGAVSVAKRIRVAKETYQIYCPLARYAGFRYLSTELEALALQGMSPWRFDVLRRWSQRKHAFDVKRISRSLQSYSDIADLVQLSTAHAESALSIVRASHLLKADSSSRALFALPTFRVAVTEYQDAYLALARLHSQFVHVPGSFQCEPHEGFISARLLMSRIGPVAEFIFTFPRIRGHRAASTIDNASFGEDFSAVAASDNEKGFTKTLRELITQSAVSVFSPKGKVYVLPKRSTVLDFAFAVHTDIGLRARSAHVNGMLRPISHELASGDIVDVGVSDTVTALPSWESVLHSPRSKSKLRQWLRDSTKDSTIELGRRMLRQALRDSRVDDDLSSHRWDHLLEATGTKELSEALYRIGSGGYAPVLAVSKLLNSTSQNNLLDVTSRHDQRSRLKLDGSLNQGINYCDNCGPLPGDDIFALMSSNGITVHREGCRIAEGNRGARAYVYPSWAEHITTPLTSRFQVNAADRHGLLADCAKVISDAQIDVIGVQTKSTRRQDANTATLTFDVLLFNRTALTECFASLLKVTGVTAVERLGIF